MASRPFAIITRPFHSSHPLIALIAAMGVEPVLAPLLTMTEIEGAQHVVETVLNTQSFKILLTSQQAARFLTKIKVDKVKHSICTVGMAAVRVLEEAHFTDVTCGGKTAEELFYYVNQHFLLTTTSLLYLRGKHISFPLTTLLQDKGYAIQEHSVYDAVAATQLPSSLTTIFQTTPRVGYIVFYSARTALVFTQLIEVSPWITKLQTITAYCLSEKIAKVIQHLPWQGLRIAVEPTTEAMTYLLKNEMMRNT